MTRVIARLMGKTIDLAVAAAPTEVKNEDGRMRAVVASAYLPSDGSQPGTHLVVYNQGDDELIAPDDQTWAVAVLYNREAALGISYLAHSDRYLSFAEALARFVTRVERQA